MYIYIYIVSSYAVTDAQRNLIIRRTISLAQPILQVFVIHEQNAHTYYMMVKMGVSNTRTECTYIFHDGADTQKQTPLHKNKNLYTKTNTSSTTSGVLYIYVPTPLKCVVYICPTPLYTPVQSLCFYTSSTTSGVSNTQTECTYHCILLTPLTPIWHIVCHGVQIHEKKQTRHSPIVFCKYLLHENIYYTVNIYYTKIYITL